MASNIGELPRAEAGEAGFSKLEATLVSTDVAPRPNSRRMNDVYRHAEKSDLNVNELDFEYSLGSNHYPLGNLRSLQQAFHAVQFHHHFANSRNFSDQTSIECLDVTADGGSWRSLDEPSLRDTLQACSIETLVNTQATNNEKCSLGSTGGIHADESPPRLVLFLVPLIPAQQTSFGNQAAITQSSVQHLFQCLQIDPFFLLNMIGRPDYWAPRSNWDSNAEGELIACDFSCQHPRWNLQVQGAPLSAYMRYDKSRKTTTYIISCKEGDTSVNALRDILNIALRSTDGSLEAFLNDPFDLHVILSTLSFEASKYHVKRFQRFMWTQINKVDDHLAGLETSNRAKLGELTKQLQVISQNADSHLASADVCIITATGIRNAHTRLNPQGNRPFIHDQVRDSIHYVIKSMEKQKIWFLNYKNRKDSTMSLVYNLVTQQDAANNIELAADMKQDSTSMNAIAALTMVFLPGTFTATVLSMFTDVENTSLLGSDVWWIWVASTAPLTLITIICWWLYKQKKNQLRGQKSAPEPRPRTQSFTLSKPRSYSLGGLSLRSRFNGLSR